MPTVALEKPKWLHSAGDRPSSSQSQCNVGIIPWIVRHKRRALARAQMKAPRRRPHRARGFRRRQSERVESGP